MPSVIQTRLGCEFCFGTLEPQDSGSVNKDIARCTICGALYHQECWQKLDCCTKCRNPIVVPVASGDLPAAGERGLTRISNEARIGCNYCFHTLDPYDRDENLRAFLECTNCHAYYHTHCWQQIAECSRCQGRTVTTLSVALPGPLEVVQNMRPVLPPEPEGSRSNWGVLLVSVALAGLMLTALALLICVLLIYASHR